MLCQQTAFPFSNRLKLFLFSSMCVFIPMYAGWPLVTVNCFSVVSCFCRLGRFIFVFGGSGNCIVALVSFCLYWLVFFIFVRLCMCVLLLCCLLFCRVWGRMCFQFFLFAILGYTFFITLFWLGDYYFSCFACK